MNEITFSIKDYCIRKGKYFVDILDFTKRILLITPKEKIENLNHPLRYGRDSNNYKNLVLRFGTVGYLNIAELTCFEGGKESKENCIDCIYQFKNKEQGINLDFEFAFYDESLIEVYFDQYVIKINPSFLFKLLENEIDFSEIVITHDNTKLLN